MTGKPASVNDYIAGFPPDVGQENTTRAAARGTQDPQ